MLTISLDTLNQLRAEKIIDARSYDNLRMLVNGMSIKEVAATAKPGRRPCSETEALARLQPGQSIKLPINGRRLSSVRAIAYRVASDNGFKVSVSGNGADGHVVVMRQGDSSAPVQAEDLDIGDGQGAELSSGRRQKTAKSVGQATQLRRRIERMGLGEAIFVPWTLDSPIGCPASTANRVGRIMGAKFSANTATKDGKEGYLITRIK